MGLGIIQWGKETVAGTDAPATQVLEDFGTAEWGNDTTTDQPELLDGSYALHSNGTTLGRLGHLDLRDGRLDFEQFPWWLNNSIKTLTPTPDAGTPIAYTYDAEPSLTANDAFDSATYEAQYDALGQQMHFGVTEQFEISLAGPRAATMLSVNVIGRKWVDGPITTPQPARVTPEQVKGTRWQLWLDDTGGTIGTTLYAGCLKGFVFRSGVLRTPYDCVEDSDSFSGIAKPRLNPSLTLRLAVTPQLAAIIDAWDNDVRQLIQLKAEGTEIHSGTPAVPKSFTIQLAARITEASRIGATLEQEQWIREFTFAGERDADWGKLFRIVVVNGEPTVRV